MRLADAMVSEEDRQICEHWIGEDNLDREPTPREWKAINVYLAAIDIECKRAATAPPMTFSFHTAGPVNAGDKIASDNTT